MTESSAPNSDVLHPNRANVSKDELRQKLSELYKANKDQVSCFGFRTQYGGGKSTGFALIYDSHEVMKKFEPHYRLVRYGAANKIEKASRKQRTYMKILPRGHDLGFGMNGWSMQWMYAYMFGIHRKGTEKPSQDCKGNSKGEGSYQGQEEVADEELGDDAIAGVGCEPFQGAIVPIMCKPHFVAHREIQYVEKLSKDSAPRARARSGCCPMSLFISIDVAPSSDY